MANSSINLTSLDFDTNKASLKTYLKSQKQFSDYNFDGSNMSVLLDILSYNTHLNSFYLNMAFSEMFLDSAQLRGSIISKAKELNYVPRSAKSSIAKLNLTFPQSGLSSFTIPAGTAFTGKNSNSSYTFISNSAVTLYPSLGGNFTVYDFPVYEGKSFTDTFLIDTTIESQKFVLSNENIDTDTIIVSVVENTSAAPTTFTRAINLYGLDSTSEIFFVQANDSTKYEIIFGDGVFGRYPLNNAVVFVTYRATTGDAANGTTNFSLDTNLGPSNGIASYVNPSIVVSAAGSGGSAPESIEEIRFNAPRHFQTQDRAITANDFKAMVLKEYTNVKNVHVFGGEEVTDSVQYGRVFISPVTYSGYSLSSADKTSIETFLSNKCTLGIKPKVVDPDYLYLHVDLVVKFDSSATTYSPNDIENIVSSAIVNYNSTYLTNFDTEFKLSRFEAAVNDSHPSIDSSQTIVTMRKDTNPDLNVESYIDVNYRNQIIPGSFFSTAFISNGNQYVFTDFNPNNNTLVVTPNNNGGVTIRNTSSTVYLKNVTLPGYESYVPAGTIDYSSGSIQLAKVNISGFVNESILKFYATCVNQNIMASQNDVIEIDVTAGITISAKPLT